MGLQKCSRWFSTPSAAHSGLGQNISNSRLSCCCSWCSRWCSCRSLTKNSKEREKWVLESFPYHLRANSWLAVVLSCGSHRIWSWSHSRLPRCWYGWVGVSKFMIISLVLLVLSSRLFSSHHKAERSTSSLWADSSSSLMRSVTAVSLPNSTMV